MWDALLSGRVHAPIWLLGFFVSALTVANQSHAYPSYGFNVPNGMRVVCPPESSGMDTSTCEVGDAKLDEPEMWCSGVAHHTCKGGSLPLNPFGAGLKQSGFVWTQSLCQADSDGDGLTNGEELGDPCCTWKRGDQPSDYMAKHVATHPGFADQHLNLSYVRPSCSGEDLQSPLKALTRSKFNANERQRSQEWKVRDFKLSKKRTVYIDVIFNFDDVEHDDFHIVFGEALIDKPKFLHHFVVQGCTRQISPEEEGKPLVRTHNKDTKKWLKYCQEQVGGFWAPGDRPMWDITTNTGVHIGRGSGIVAFSVNIHYTGGDMASEKIYPKDGIRIHYTPDLRPKTHVITPLIRIIGISGLPGGIEENVDKLGGKFLDVPPGKKRWFLTRQCTVRSRCKDSSSRELRSLSSDIIGSCSMIKTLGFCTGLIRILCPETCGSPDTCTGGDKPLRVMDTFFHAHLLGAEMYQSVRKANTGDIVDLGSMRHWSYEDETIVPLDGKGVELRVGDTLSSTCVYNSESKLEATHFGLSTFEEMCLNTLGVEMDTEDKHYGFAFNCEGSLWSGDLGDTQSALNIHSTETLLKRATDCWSNIGNELDCTKMKERLIYSPSPRSNDLSIVTSSSSSRNVSYPLFPFSYRTILLLIACLTLISHIGE